MTLIREAIAKKVILPHILPIFRHSLAQIVSKIAKFERISNFSDLNHGNTSTDRVSAQNYHNWWSYFQKGNFAPNLAHIWIFSGQILPKIAKFEGIPSFSNIYHGNSDTNSFSFQNDNYLWWYCQKCNFDPNSTHIWTNFHPK